MRGVRTAMGADATILGSSMVFIALEERNKPAGVEAPAGIDSRTREAVEQAIAQAFVVGFRWIMVVAAVLAIAGAASAWILMRNRPDASDRRWTSG